MINFFIFFVDFLLKRKFYKTQKNRKFNQKIGEKIDQNFHKPIIFV